MDVQKLWQLEFGINFLNYLHEHLEALNMSEKIHTCSVWNVLAESLAQNSRKQPKTLTNFHQLELLLYLPVCLGSEIAYCWLICSTAEVERYSERELFKFSKYIMCENIRMYT